MRTVKQAVLELAGRQLPIFNVVDRNHGPSVLIHLDEWQHAMEDVTALPMAVFDSTPHCTALSRTIRNNRIVEPVRSGAPVVLHSGMGGPGWEFRQAVRNPKPDNLGLLRFHWDEAGFRFSGYFVEREFSPGLYHRAIGPRPALQAKEAITCVIREKMSNGRTLLAARVDGKWWTNVAAYQADEIDILDDELIGLSVPEAQALVVERELEYFQA